MDTVTRAKTKRFFEHITRDFKGPRPPSCVVVTHLVNGRDVFLDALNRVAPIKLVIPKPSSIHEETLARAEARYSVRPLSRSQLADPLFAKGAIENAVGNDPYVILDIGGYFAPVVRPLADMQQGQFLGVVEDTENGFQKYARVDTSRVPVVSAARSPLKDTEDLLVGESVVHSTEHLLRSLDVVAKGKVACVIGFGKLGRSISEMLRARGNTVKVFDIDPIRSVIASSNGFAVTRNKLDALQGADLVICATGNYALSGQDFLHLKPGAFVSSVTSSDDELDMSYLSTHFTSKKTNANVTQYRCGQIHFSLLADGNAVNFLHGASVGPYIALVQAELIAATSLMGQGKFANGLSELDATSRQYIAGQWLDTFNDNFIETTTSRRAASFRSASPAADAGWVSWSGPS